MAPRGQRNIVVLSGSATAAQSLSHKTASAVGRTGARVFAIVPGSNEGNDLPALVDKSAGSITQTSVGRLPGATNALAHVVGDQYLFSYQSVASPGDLLDISMTVKGHPLKTEVTVPSSATPNASPTPNPALFSGTRGYLLIAVIIVALLVLTSIPGRVRRRRRAGGGGGGNRGGGGGGEGPRRRERRERRREERQRR